MSTGPEATSDQLDATTVQLLYEALLGRKASEADVDYHLTHSGSVRAFLEIVFSSTEYAARNPQARQDASAPVAFVANMWHPDLDAWTHPPGTQSFDDVAIVGTEGWVFLQGGSNEYVPQFTGALQMAPEWLGQWRQLMAGRRAEADALGVQLEGLVVPEKVAINSEHYPHPLVPAGPRPIEQLLAAGLPLLYPLAELRAAQAERQVCLRTDSHLTTYGNAILHAPLLEALGAPPVPPSALPRADPYVASGDLGSRYTPSILEAMHTPLSLGIAELVEDNWGDIIRTGGHIGTRRVFRSPAAPDPRTVVLFGDSYGFGDKSYQGTAWFLAQAFRETHFVWAPFGWDPGYVEQVDADIVVSQTAERFVARVPMGRVDVGTLAAEALAKDSFVEVDEIFADKAGA